MKLPPLMPPMYVTWATHQQGMFWNIFLALVEAGGYLPFGPDFWKLTGALTRARWDANRAAVLAAFEFLGPDASGSSVGASGSRQIFYRPLLEILELQKRKLRSHRSSRDEEEISEVSTGIHKGAGSSSLSLSFDFDSQDARARKKKARGERCPLHPEAAFTQWGECGECYGQRTDGKYNQCEPA